MAELEDILKNRTTDLTIGGATDFIKIKHDGGISQTTSATIDGDYVVDSVNKYVHGNSGSNVYNLLQMDASCFVELFSDSSGEGKTQFFYILWNLLAVKFPDTVFLYNEWSNSSSIHLGYDMINATTYAELRGLRPNNTIQRLPRIPIDLPLWTSPDLDVACMISDYDMTGDLYLFTCAKSSGSSNRIWEIRSESVSDATNPLALHVRWSNGTTTQSIYFDDFFLGETEGILLRVTIEADDGLGNHIARCYKSDDNEKTWDLFEEKTIAGVMVINKITGASYMPCGTIHSAVNNGPVTFHRGIVRNGINGERISFPANIESLEVEFYNFDYTGKPVCYFVNHGIGGKDYDDFDDALMKANSYPDQNPLTMINLGHNNTTISFNDLYDTITAFIGRLETSRVNPNKYFTTQHPWREDAGESKAQRSHTQPYAIRTYSQRNDCGYVDTATRIYVEMPDWRDEMLDSLHPGPVIQQNEAQWHFEYFSKF